MSVMNELYNKISAAQVEYQSAVARGSGISAAKERVKNTLFNNLDSILEALQSEASLERDVKALEEQCDMLTAALEEMDKENDEVRGKLREMESNRNAKKTKNKTDEKVMTAVVE